MCSVLNKIDELISTFDPQNVQPTKLPQIREFRYYPLNKHRTSIFPFLPYQFDYESLDKAKQYLFQEGFVVFKNVLNEEDINTSKQLFWKWINAINIGWNKNNPLTWTNATFPGYKKTGVIYKKGIGQSQLQWYIRTRPKLLSIFTKLWNENSYKDLLTSYDGIGIYRPFKLQQCNEYKTREQWFHVDQHHNELPHFDVYQGIVALQKQNECTGGTVIIPKSHLVFKEATQNIETNFKKLAADHWILNDEKYCKLLIQMDAGDLLIWDGRTIHCNTYALQEGYDIQDEFVRMVSYITMAPKSKMNQHDLDEDEYSKYRLKAYRDKTTTGHWPHKENIVNELNEMELQSMKQNTFEFMNDTMRSLVGWEADKPDWYSSPKYRK